jgi:hypothetical protein
MRRLAIGLACVTLAVGCLSDHDDSYRGAGLQPATLPDNEVARAYRAAIGGAFDLRDPSLSILIDPVLLPRSQGLAGGDTMPPSLQSALVRLGVSKGTCRIPIQAKGPPLVCRAERPGYVVRFSAPLASRAIGDTVQVYLVAQQYAIPGGPVEQRLRFERAYQLVRSNGNWRAIGEARLPQP